MSERPDLNLQLPSRNDMAEQVFLAGPSGVIGDHPNLREPNLLFEIVQGSCPFAS